MKFTLLSKEEEDFISQGIEENMRADGRGSSDMRPFTVETGIIPQASGSARIKLSSTDVLVGIKAEIGEPTKHNQGKIICSVECSSIASQEFEGRGAEDLNNELTQVLQRIISINGVIDLESLCIIPGSQCWVLYVDALVLDFGGNIFDAIFFAVRSALHNTRIPKVSVVDDGIGNKEIQISEDPDEVISLNINNLPICLTVFLVGRRFILDATLEEEICSDSRFIIAVNRHGKVCFIQKLGGGSYHPSMISSVTDVVKKAGPPLILKLESVLKEEEILNRPKLGFFYQPHA